MLWLRSTVGGTPLAGELTMSCARPAADGWVNRPLHVANYRPTQPFILPGSINE